jgi:hypothetical protein|tara:strand:- start:153 stop:392 length:240 start_codon:yes stop_codon:yes gene_type:complete
MKKILFFIFLNFIYSNTVEAYIGLGPLIPIIGSSIVFLWGLIVVLFGLFSYPLIKLYKFIKNRQESKLDLENKDEFKNK